MLGRILIPALLACVASGGLAGHAAAQAAAAPSVHSFSGNLGLASQYRYRGIAQTDGKPALQGGFDYAHADGPYAGTWASNVGWLSDADARVGNSLEWDVYGGYRRSVGDLGYDAGLLYYGYPGRYPVAFNSPNTVELYLAASWKTLTLKYSHALTDLFGFVDSRGAGYLDLAGSVDLGHGIALVAHVGRQGVPAGATGGIRVRAARDCSYHDWRLGLSAQAVGLKWALAYVDTDARGGTGQCYRNAAGRDLGNGALVLSVGKTF